MKTCVISFSSRADGNCAAIADCVQETLGAEGLTRFDFSGLSVHGCGACHCECFRQREACPYFADDAFRLNEAAALADRAVFIVPNYCDFPCSNFFLFNERSQCCFNGHAELADRYLAVPKKFIVVSNTGRENFLAAFRDHVLPKTEPGPKWSTFSTCTAKYSGTRRNRQLSENQMPRCIRRVFVKQLIRPMITIIGRIFAIRID